MNEINRLRKKIDKIDLQILNLLNKRSKIAENIGKEKRSKNLFRPERQANILKNLLKSDNEINNFKMQQLSTKNLKVSHLMFSLRLLSPSN